MRRRLLFVMLSTVFSALLLAALVTFFGIRQASISRGQDNLADYATGLVEQHNTNSKRALQSFQRTLGLEWAAVLEFRDPSEFPDDETSKVGLPAAFVVDPKQDGNALEAGGTALIVKAQINRDGLETLAQGKQVTGSVGDRVFAAVTVRNAKQAKVAANRAIASGRNDPSAESVQVLLLVSNAAGDARFAFRIIALASIAALLLAAVAALATARRITKPLVAATWAYKRIAAGDLTVRLSQRDGFADRKDEIGELVRSLNTMTESLDRAQKQEQQFLLSVSHDLRTPLTSIRGFAEAISEGTAPDQQRAATVIASQARRLERLVADLLDLAKLNAGRFTLKKRIIDLTDLVTDTADGFLPTAEAAGLQLVLEADDNLRISADPERLAQALANLIENACKFANSTVTVSVRGPSGTSPVPEPLGSGLLERAGHLPGAGAIPGLANLAAKRSAPGSASGAISISVSDDGPGIAPEDVDQVFQRHFTSDRRPARTIGSGLGLAIVKELIDTMGATITPTTSSSGTTFTITLPLASGDR
jgi:signal transduction histidine kinase